MVRAEATFGLRRQAQRDAALGGRELVNRPYPEAGAKAPSPLRSAGAVQREHGLRTENVQSPVIPSGDAVTLWVEIRDRNCETYYLAPEVIGLLPDLPSPRWREGSRVSR